MKNIFENNGPTKPEQKKKLEYSDTHIELGNKEVCTECHGQGSYWTEGNPDSAGDLHIPTPDVEFDGTVLVKCWKCTPEELTEPVMMEGDYIDDVDSRYDEYVMVQCKGHSYDGRGICRICGTIDMFRPLGHITSVTEDEQGITVQGTLTEAGEYFMVDREEVGEGHFETEIR